MQTRHFQDLKDKRLLRRGNFILNRLFTQSVHSIRQLTHSDSEAKAMYRFLQNDNVSEEAIIRNMSSNCVSCVGNKSVLCIQDTNLRNVSNVLQKAEIKLMEFDKITPKKGDFVYFDPPYHPTDTNSFTTYTKSDFTEKDQIRLRDFALELTKKGVNVMLSNSNVKFIRAIYGSKYFNIDIVNAPRNVNCKPNKRGAVEEVLITNY